MMGQQASNQSEKPQQICPLPAFKSGEFALPKTFITEWRLHVQNRFKRCIFQCAAKQGVLEIIKNSMVGGLYEFHCLCFALGPAPIAFTKLLKFPVSVLRCLMIHTITFLEDLLIFGNTIEEILVARDSVIFLLQHLEFVINFKKCVLEPTQFLGIIVNSNTMTLSLSQEKVQKIKRQRLEMYRA